jgi:GntR family transcriptional repressor for pyruvate dehydrogenase complex
LIFISRQIEDVMVSDSTKRLRDETGKTDAVTSRVVAQLIELIDRGEIRPGEKVIPERELARKLKVSRQSLRTGIAFLGMIGVLRSVRSQGTFVSPEITLHPNNASQTCGGAISAQLIEARVRLGSILAELAIPRLTEKQMGELAEEIVEMHAELNDPEKFANHVMRFHRIIVRAAANMVLFTMLETITENLDESSIITSLAPQDRLNSASIHREIFKAIRNRDTSRARRLIEGHLSATFRFLLCACSREPQAVALHDQAPHSTNSRFG